MAFNGTGSNVTSLNASNVASGTLAVGRGGTGATTLNSAAVIIGNGTSAPTFVAPGTSGNILTSNGTAWTSATPAGGGVTSLNGETGAITNTAFNAIGSYTTGAILTNGTYTVGNTAAGSSILLHTAGNGRTAFNQVRNNDPTSSLSKSGTWRAMGESNTFTDCGIIFGGANLWVRIS
jgi:hypothetical protein